MRVGRFNAEHERYQHVMRQAIGGDTMRRQLDEALRRQIPVRERMPLRVGTIPEIRTRRYGLGGEVISDVDEPA
jgi:hypothetical protein